MPVDREPPSWIDDFGSIETDIQAMEEFAATLANEVATGYEPHLQQVVTAMLTELPAGSADFPELGGFLTRHHEVQQQTFSNAFNFRDGTHHFATVAKSISDEYGTTDAYAHAKVADVTDAFAAASDPLSGETKVDG
ncbi:hypothetical protein ACFQFC_27340 [Amorphoplanes digitatis]|uniref:Uncharacterized protein n=1 Tax=Actinoplanes digitatis TaxID=1868 RepID=A0A7W7MN17_9ACTN|nr:hypothetical protein [Actinoplanes digitatis]MBB4759859.1 hypothetical protein [Actinoplanes digitatis]BFE67827.1 hypothetical protein GCM10020092_011280 [Actinoplanes digitatis]GID94465.1 hypothetical protein Adi01nite_38770 [Actinoplanes digitatis]